MNNSETEAQGRQRWRWTFVSAAFCALGVAVAWCAKEPSFESVLAVLGGGGILAVVVYFGSRNPRLQKYLDQIVAALVLVSTVLAIMILWVGGRSREADPVEVIANQPVITGTPTSIGTSTAQPVITGTPVSTGTPTTTAAPEPTVTFLPLITPGLITPAAMSAPFFQDDFENDEIGVQKWIVKTDGLYAQDGYLKADLTNDASQYTIQLIEAELGIAFSTVEFDIVVLDGSDSGALGFRSHCSDNSTSLSAYSGGLHLEFFANGTLKAVYGYGEGKSQFETNLQEYFESGETYRVRLVQDEGLVRAYIGNTELPEFYMCNRFGITLGLYAGASPGNHIIGYFDNIEAWSIDQN